MFPQHHNIRCVTGDTPEEAIQNRIAHGYALDPQPWPKGLPEAARPFYIDGKGMVPKGSIADEVFYVACYAYQPGGYKPGGTPAAFLPVVRATGAEFTDGLTDKVARSVLRSQPAGSKVSCRTGDTAEAAQEVRGSAFLQTAEIPWPADVRLSLMGSKAPPQPKKVVTAPKPAPKPAQAPALTIKEDTSAKDAAKAWDEQVKKTLAAEAQKKVETAAKQAQADAKLKADYEAFFAERRKQGRAQ
jgi:hypothetical protein